ncbi:helix-turn-helix domain-containing protein [Streptomyces sp. NPDC020298]|uniref:helix-turn-helix domain-containing protein n=1 Tax=unclassified Streptomyces TaxID=2593676 RepID=UPI0033C25578
MSTRSPALTGDDRKAYAEDLAELYHAGASIRGIAARTGRSYGNVRQLLLDAGVKLRARGGPRTGARA